MRRQFVVLFALLIIGIDLFATGNLRDSSFIARLTKMADFGKARLKKQIELNAINDKNNLHHLNNYILDFQEFDKDYNTTEFNDLTTQLNTGGSYSGNDVLGPTHTSNLNNHLIAANSGVNPDIYIAVNLRLGLVIETKDIQPGQLSQIDNSEAKTNKIAKIRFQNYAQLEANHVQIRTYFTQNLADDITGEFVLFTWGKYYRVSEDASNTTQAKLRLNSSGYYDMLYDGVPSINASLGQKITAYVTESTGFTATPRKTAADLVAKFKLVIDGLKVALANPTDIDKLLLEGIITRHNLKKVGKFFMNTYFHAAKGDGALEKLTELAVYLDNIDTALYNGYVNGVKDRLDFDNYSYWFDQPPPSTNEFNKGNIAIIYEKIKSYNEAFLYIKDKANKGVITKAEFKKYFDDHLTWGGDNHKYFHPNPLVLLSANEKVNILKAIAKDITTTFVNRSTQDYARDEDLVINILKTTPKEETRLVLDGLKSSKLLYKIVDKFTFSDFNEIIEGLSAWIFYNYPVKDELKKLSDPASSEIAWNELLGQKRAVYFNDNYFGRRNSEAMDGDGNIHVEVRKWFNNTDEYEITVDPYKYVIVRFENNFEIAGNKFFKGQSYLLPALTAYLLFVEDTRAKWFQSGKILVDAGLCLIGIGEMKAALKAGQWGRLALATADMGIGIGDIVINTAFRNEIETEFPGFFEVWQKVSLCYGLGRLGQIGLEAAFKRAYAESYLIKNSDEFSEEVRDFAEKANTKLGNPDQFSEFADDIQLDNIWPREPHIYIPDITTKIQAKRNHIFAVDWKNPATQTKFTGLHHQSALDAVGVGNYQKNITTPPNAYGVYEAEVKVKNSSGNWIVKSGNNGNSTFFPDAWSEAETLAEVEYAAKNNLGRYTLPINGNPPPPNLYYGLSKDNNIKIGFYYNPDGSIGSYFPIL